MRIPLLNHSAVLPHRAPVMEGLEDRRLMSVTLSAGSVTGVEGKDSSGLLATFVSNDPAPQLAGSYVATIDWGDGQTSTARVKADGTVAGQFDVIAKHRYAE